MKIELKEVEIEIKSITEVAKEADAVFQSVKEGKHVKYEGRKIIVPTLDLLRKLLTPERIRMLHVIKKYKPSSIYDLAKIMKKDRRNVLKDLHFLNDFGLVAVKKEPKLRFPRRNMVPSVSFSRIVVGIPI
jgi:predicted transcriptional regulator